MRDDFIATGTPKVFVSSHGGSRVKLSLWPFCGWILGPLVPRQFGGHLTCKENDVCDILPVGPGGSKLLNQDGGTSLSSLYRNYPECNSDGKGEMTSFEKWLESNG